MYFLHCSGYADRICELMSVSRELRISGGSGTVQNKDTGSYFVEAKYIEFEGVKVGVGTSNLNLNFCNIFSRDHLYTPGLAVTISLLVRVQS